MTETKYRLWRILTPVLLMFGVVGGVFVTSPAAQASACVITKDASAPAVVHSASGVASATTASFTPPANSLLEVRVNTLQKTAGALTVSVTDSQGGTYAAGPNLSGSTVPASVRFYERYLSSAPGAMTITANQSGTGLGSIQLKVLVLTGAASNQAGAATSTFQGTGTAMNRPLTTTQAGSMVFASAATNSGSSNLTAVSGTANNDRWNDTADARTGGMGQSTNPVATVGTANYGWTAAASAAFIWAAQEVLPADCSPVQNPPTVTTDAATSVTQNTATLNGRANPNGAATTCHFEYGTTTAYGTSTPNDTSPGSGTTAVPVTANLTGLTASTTYHDRLVCSNSGGTTNGADSTFTTSAVTPPPVNLLTDKGMLYNTEIGAWVGPSGAAFSNSTVINNAKAANPSAIRFALYDCFTDQTCGRDNHTGSISRANFDTQVQKITGSTGYNRPLWLKLLPIAKGAIGAVPDGAIFCPATTNFGMNLNMFKGQLDEIKAAGYTGPIVLESSNEAEYTCSSFWGFTSAGAVGVSKNIGDMYVATMPALIKYARTLGFSQVVSVGYIGIGGGPNWGTSMACTADATKTFGYACGYNNRWMTEFNTEVHNAYVANGNDPDYVPNAESIHAYPHSPDFTSTAGYDFPDGEAYAYYRNWLVQSRGVADTIWGASLGDSILFSISEWNAGADESSGKWVGWTTAGMPGAFYDGWYSMLRGDGNMTGTGTRYWEATLFEVASNGDTGSGSSYNIIHQDGTVPAWYTNWKNQSLGDPR